MEHRVVVKFLTKEGLTHKIIKERLDSAYDQSSASYSVVKEWAGRFLVGQEFLEDDERPERPVEVITEDKVVLLEELALSDRRYSIIIELRYQPAYDREFPEKVKKSGSSYLIQRVHDATLLDHRMSRGGPSPLV
nr:unnamed protein product [Callosobruchus analis]